MLIGAYCCMDYPRHVLSGTVVPLDPIFSEVVKRSRTDPGLILD